MTELEMFAKLPQLNENRKKDQEGGYLPILSKCIDGKYRLSYDCCYAFDSIYDAIANTPEEAIRNAYEWCDSNNLL